MYRIGIIGSENSHAIGFTRKFNTTDLYPDFKVVALGGHYKEESEKLAKEYGVEFIADKPEDMLGKVDAVMITARDGKFHYEFARPFIEAGLPAFIDKPFTVSKEDAIALAKLAKEKNVPLCGGSSLKYAYDTITLKNAYERDKEHFKGAILSAPLHFSCEYSGFYFYASHLAEMTYAIFGDDAKSVKAYAKNENVTAIVNYDNFYVVNQFVDDCTIYHGIIYNTQRCFDRNIDLGLAGNIECDVFANMVRTGEMDQTYKQLIAPVFYLNAIEESYKTGKEVDIIVPEI